MIDEDVQLVCEEFGFSPKDVTNVTRTSASRYVVTIDRAVWWCDRETGDAHVIDYVI